MFITYFKKTKLYLAYKDIKNYLIYKKLIQRDEKDPNSTYNKLKLNHNKFYTLNYIISLPDGAEQLNDEQRLAYVTEAMRPSVEYINNELRFGEYLVADIQQFYDENNEPTLSYGIIFSFEFITLTFKQIIEWLFDLGVIFALIYFWHDIIQFVKSIFI